MGIIVINKGRYDDFIKSIKNKNAKFALKLSEFAFYKVTLIHEISFHYFLVILFSNGKINCLITPETLFKNYKIDKKAKCDFGDKGEVILFGKQVRELYINVIVNIINLKYWNDNINKKPVEIGKIFLELNKEKESNGECTINNLIKLSGFTEKLFEKINKEIDMEPFIITRDVGDFFSRGKILNVNMDELDIEGRNFATIFPRGFCLNAGRYY